MKVIVAVALKSLSGITETVGDLKIPVAINNVWSKDKYLVMNSGDSYEAKVLLYSGALGARNRRVWWTL